MWPLISNKGIFLITKETLDLLLRRKFNMLIFFLKTAPISRFITISELQTNPMGDLINASKEARKVKLFTCLKGRINTGCRVLARISLNLYCFIQVIFIRINVLIAIGKWLSFCQEGAPIGLNWLLFFYFGIFMWW